MCEHLNLFLDNSHASIWVSYEINAAEMANALPEGTPFDPARPESEGTASLVPPIVLHLPSFCEVLYKLIRMCASQVGWN
jgi:hypothetical protein